MSDIKQLEGLTLASITGMHRSSEEVVFTSVCGRQFRMHHWQNCCESVRIEDVCGDVEDLIGHPVSVAEERTQREDGHRYESATWTFYSIATNKGTVDLRWLGTSNGYYSERVDFEELS